MKQYIVYYASANSLRQKYVEPDKLFQTACHVHIWGQKAIYLGIIATVESRPFIV